MKTKNFEDILESVNLCEGRIMNGAPIEEAFIWLRDELDELTWIVTDPDVNQKGRRLKDGVYEFKQDETPVEEINLSQYPVKEQEHIINAYGYTLVDGDNKNDNLENIVERYGRTEAEWLIAECIFETLYCNA